MRQTPRDVLPINHIRRASCIAMFLTSLVPGFSFGADECDKSFPDHMSEVQCINQLNKKLDDELNIAYKAALVVRPEKDQWDIRKNSEQLRKSQRAWLKFKEENCALIGGLEGGSNLSVSEFDSRCLQEETIARTKFLRRIANGEFGG
ncbi:lysozyme inhibitor LprI family protein [Duganella vulcania]|uniref:DUF1311 domain-containing protein n=1 Tax=Duganella vulcania TaxID=2692166 RepID=A0A845GKV9_9BURK|nr:lysozyme inhibitor LprI family protein [Duganella vulcania]MYM93996.1 DUF1311 domain-containing protein [Duganella vulcania]